MHHAVDKDTRAILALMPTNIWRDAFPAGRLTFLLGRAHRAVFRRECHIAFLSENFCLTPSENLPGALVPRIDSAFGIRRENREALCAFEDEAQALFRA